MEKIMFKSFFKIAIRNLLRHKTFSIINIIGLSIGIACTILMMMWIVDELSWDKFHVNAKTLYRVEQDQPTQQGLFHVNQTPYGMGPALKLEIPEVKNVTRSAFPGTILIKAGEIIFYEDNAVCVDPSYLEMFSFPLIKGDYKTALNEPSSMVITEEIAEKYFGKSEPIGKTLLIDSKYSFKVTGVLKNLPANTSLRSNILLPISFQKDRGINTENWRTNQIITWVQLYDNVRTENLNNKISELRYRHVLQQIQSSPGGNKNPKIGKVQFQLMPITDLRLYARFGFGQSVGSVQSVSIFSILALFILIIASINFMNLSTAQSAGRAKEVGLRKVVGAVRTSLAKQFYSESILITVLSAFLALVFVEMLLPVFNSVSGKNFSFLTPFQSDYLLAIFFIVLLTGIISGTYPAIFLSSFRPVEVLKGKFSFSAKGSFLRKALVVFQFALSIILIISTFTLSKQLAFMRNKNLGYEKEQLIYLPLRGETQRTYGFLKDELLKEPLISGVSGTQQEPTYMSANGTGSEWEGKDPAFNPLVGFGVVDYDYVETMKISLIEGRDFSKSFASDSISGVLINEALMKLMGGNSVVGKKFKWANDGIIVGVMKNYHYSPIQTAIEPQAVYVSPKQVNFAIVRLKEGNIHNSLEKVKAAWKNVNPEYPFEYKFFDEDFNQMFQADERMGILFRYASIFAIIVACLGLFGLSSFMAEQRIREIGVRKVLGATVAQITTTFSKEFVKWVLLANLVAWPIAYYILEKLLQNYAYRMPFHWWLYPIAFIISVGVALVTVSYQTIHAAIADPAKSLRYE
ncbi:MAG: ABC transporter permease [Ignavibacteriales bacterium]|nr:MAG: ABC transporter permease [Ignavibacteriales bacterium]